MNIKDPGTSPQNPHLASFTRRRLILSVAAFALVGTGVSIFLKSPALAGEVVMFKDRSYTCCDRWTRHLRLYGFSVDTNVVEDLAAIKASAGIPPALHSCHTAFIDGYLIEGHVPALDIRRMLSQRPKIMGLSVPGLPQSAPGMVSPEFEPFTVLAFDDQGTNSVFASYR